MQKLDLALERFGSSSDGIREKLLAQAEALAQTTSATDDQVIAVQTLLANMDLAPNVIQRVTAAATDLSATFGIEFEAAATALARSLSGSGRELARLIPQVRELDESALRAGEALKIVEERFSGNAQAQLNTFTGAVGELSESFGELAEAIGRPIAESDLLVAGIQRLTGAVRELASGGGAQARSFFADFLAGAFPLLGALTNLAQKQTEVSTTTALTAEQLQRVTASAAGLAPVVQTAAEAWNVLAVAEERAVRIAGEQVAAQSELTAALAKAGVTLRDFDAELLNQERALLLLDQALREGRISLEEYNFHVALVRANLAKIRTEMTGAAEDTDVFTVSLLGLTDAARGARLEVSGLGSSLQSVAASRTAMDGALGAFVIPGLVPSFDARTGARKFGVTNPFGVRFVPISTRPF
jgi:hypothetical protein